MLKDLFFLLVILSCPSFLTAQIRQPTLKEILEFEVDSTRQKMTGWLTASFTEKIRTRVENDTLRSGKSALMLNFPPTKKDKSAYCMATGFLMPITHTSHDMQASFICKNQGFDTVQLIFTGYNTDGNRVSIDTLEIGKTADWHEATTTVRIGDVSYMHLALELSGNVANIEKTLWLNKIQLNIDGIDLTDYAPRNLEKEYAPDINKITKLSFENPTTYQQIELLANKKIVTLGESLHGSETLKESAVQIMKHRILYNNCKLVLLEIPLEKTLSINRFVQGDDRFELDTIAKILELSFYSHELLDFMVWLREYNGSTAHKVYLLGMDAPSTEFYSFTTELFDYFYRTNKERMNDSIKKFLKLIIADCRKAMGPVLASLKEDVDFKSNSDSLEIKIIEHWWNDWLKVSVDDEIDVVRDSIMYSSAKFMTNLLCAPSETATLHSHLEHGCYDKTHTISHYPRMSYGSLLKKEFGDDYCTLGLFAYQGEVLAIPSEQQIRQRDSNFVTCVLGTAPSNGLEHLLSKFGSDYFYIPVTSLPNTQLYVRVGTNAKQLVNIIHPSHYMDGVIYVKESKAMHVIHEDLSLDAKYQSVMKRFNEYESLVK